jgi:glycine/D-amino acid oxidase-like deaminating enzyme
VLWLAGDDSYSSATYATLRRCGYAVQKLSRDELSTRFPHINTGDLAVGLLEPDCGVVMARRAIQSLVADLESRGVGFVRARVIAPSSGHRVQYIQTQGGDRIAGDAFVFACGPWLPAIFPDLLRSRIRPTRQVVVYFGTPAGDARFGPAHTPAWVDFGAGIYGVPDLEHRGIKVGIDRHGPAFDPDCDDRVTDAASIAVARTWLTRRMPALARSPVNESRVCQYENTDTGDFLIDRHPDFDNLWIAGGGSGHGFKHGPAVGRHVAGLATGTEHPIPRFALATRGTVAQRSVY